MDAHGYQIVEGGLRGQLRADGANEIGARTVNAQSQELVSRDAAIAEIVQILDELRGDILSCES